MRHTHRNSLDPPSLNPRRCVSPKGLAHAPPRPRLLPETRHRGEHRPHGAHLRRHAVGAGVRQPQPAGAPGCRRPGFSEPRKRMGGSGGRGGGSRSPPFCPTGTSTTSFLNGAAPSESARSSQLRPALYSLSQKVPPARVGPAGRAGLQPGSTRRRARRPPHHMYVCRSCPSTTRLALGRGSKTPSFDPPPCLGPIICHPLLGRPRRCGEPPGCLGRAVDVRRARRLGLPAAWGRHGGPAAGTLYNLLYSTIIYTILYYNHILCYSVHACTATQ